METVLLRKRPERPGGQPRPPAGGWPCCWHREGAAQQALLGGLCTESCRCGCSGGSPRSPAWSRLCSEPSPALTLNMLLALCAQSLVPSFLDASRGGVGTRGLRLWGRSEQRQWEIAAGVGAAKGDVRAEDGTARSLRLAEE